MSEDKYDNYIDDDFLADLNAYAEKRDAEQAEDNAELKQHLGEMVGGFLGVWWYLRAFGAASSRNIRTYAAVADKQAKLTAWETADDQMNQEHPHYQSKVTIMNEFGACSRCLPYLGDDYTLVEAKSLVPFHYNCRCTIVRDTSDFDVMTAGTATAIVNNQLYRYDDPKGNRLAQQDVDELLNYFDTDKDIIVRGQDIDKHLEYHDALGVTWNTDTILIHSEADRATLAEELFHRQQLLRGEAFTLEDTNRLEIEAKQYLINHANVLKLSDEEVLSTINQLKSYQKGRSQ
ncbi:hypothetical protein FKV75_03870 [Weissella paramesenteroides]|uniref:hypothetical protein n=1 Tax=Weissella paramesenteroides TaxID=1249 RepID=UPI0012390039|nr:hypothetical protein [Weissella paramesenteroides]KAA8440437.1 hypothetical protein FKV77_08135 [Weissella paramesenteroides]KAA8440972.1 hypothetical protein FKV81_04845 [Weissella paramesenteroides]KAA8443403.1 hypothetical protein FKV75_03870 [Weissella paramesenteroides]KAA8447692.1 hypothetical protein FKV76_04090 [Weissella paramesenteroides]KAA8449705.1 hypothetical protein FKV74_05825 [Weissella paramesenteroides]